jgi:hypothetical protein
MPDVYYCDNYEELTGRNRDGSIRDNAETKVVTSTDPGVDVKDAEAGAAPAVVQAQPDSESVAPIEQPVSEVAPGTPISPETV